jgi:hypothetical protein
MNTFGRSKVFEHAALALDAGDGHAQAHTVPDAAPAPR